MVNIYVFVEYVSSNRGDISLYVDRNYNTLSAHDHIHIFCDAVTNHELDIVCDIDHIRIRFLSDYRRETMDYLKRESDMVNIVL